MPKTSHFRKTMTKFKDFIMKLPRLGEEVRCSFRIEDFGLNFFHRKMEISHRSPYYV